MTIGERRIVAQIKPREQARAAFEAARARGNAVRLPLGTIDARKLEALAKLEGRAARRARRAVDAFRPAIVMLVIVLVIPTWRSQNQTHRLTTPKGSNHPTPEIVRPLQGRRKETP